MEKNFKVPLFIGITFFALLALGACAGSKTYLLDLHYDSSQTSPFLAGQAQPVTLAVYDLKDVRPDRLYIGRRVRQDDQVDFFKSDAGSVEQVLTQSLVHLLEKAGFRVVLVKRYLDPGQEDFKDIPAPAALGGEIEVLWVESKTGIATTQTEATLRLRFHWALVKERTWLHKTIEGSASESDRPFFRSKYAETKINEVFQDGLDKLLKDEPTLKSKLLPNP
jgi:hypothetical protein